jgi:hypothetical protein
MRFDVDCQKREFVSYNVVAGTQTLVLDPVTGDLSITENGPATPIISTVNLNFDVDLLVYVTYAELQTLITNSTVVE